MLYTDSTRVVTGHDANGKDRLIDDITPATSARPGTQASVVDHAGLSRE